MKMSVRTSFSRDVLVLALTLYSCDCITFYVHSDDVSLLLAEDTMNKQENCKTAGESKGRFFARNAALCAIAYPSVRLPDTRVDQSKTFQVGIIQFVPHSSSIPLVLRG